MTKVKVSHRKPTKVAYIEHHGPYEQVPWGEDIEKLYAYAKQSHLRPGFRPMAIYPDDPATTERSKCRSQVALPVKGEARPTEEVLVADLPATDVAEMRFEGPSSAYEGAYATLRRWVDANGYELAGAPREVFTKKPKVVAGQTRLYSRIELPVRRR